MQSRWLKAVRLCNETFTLPKSFFASASQSSSRALGLGLVLIWRLRRWKLAIIYTLFFSGRPPLILYQGRGGYLWKWPLFVRVFGSPRRVVMTVGPGQHGPRRSR